MEIIIGVVIAAVVLYFAACTVSGMKPTATRLASFESETPGQPRFYSDPLPAVMQAYGEAATKAAGMNVADGQVGTLLVDASPTMRVLGGSFGMLVRYTFVPSNSGTTVQVDASPKISWAVSVNPQHALTEVERTVRMKAKSAAGLTEINAGQVSSKFIAPANRRYEGS